jgi:hypothetical protein
MDGLAQFIPLILIFTVAVVWFRLAKKSRTKEVERYNKKHNKNFKTWEELERYRKIKTEKLIEEEQKISVEKKRLEKERQKEERITTTEPSSSDIGARLKKLRQMYKDGILSKVEFEKAKNKLLQ